MDPRPEPDPRQPLTAPGPMHRFACRRNSRRPKTSRTAPAALPALPSSHSTMNRSTSGCSTPWAVSCTGASVTMFFSAANAVWAKALLENKRWQDYSVEKPARDEFAFAGFACKTGLNRRRAELRPRSSGPLFYRAVLTPRIPPFYPLHRPTARRGNGRDAARLRPRGFFGEAGATPG